MTTRQYNVGSKIALLIVRLEVQNSKMASNRKLTNFEGIVKNEYDAADCYLCSNELQHSVGKQISLSITNDFINLSPSQPNAPRIWRNLLITSVPWLFSDVFDLFHRKCLNKLFIQYIGYRNYTYCIVLYRKNLPNTHPYSILYKQNF